MILRQRIERCCFAALRGAKFGLPNLRLAFASCALVIMFGEARSQTMQDRSLYDAAVKAQRQIGEASRAGDGDRLAAIYQESMIQLFAYKQRYGMSNGLTDDPCQRAYEELAVSAMFMASYLQPERHISGPVDRTGDGRSADQWWRSHREALADCEQKLGVKHSEFSGPEALTPGR